MNKLVLFLLSLFALSIMPVSAQFSLGGGLGGTSVSIDAELDSSLDKEAYRPGETALLSVAYTFPEGYHQSYSPEHFKISGYPDQGILFGSTIYPEGVEDENGDIQYYDSAVLKIEMRISEDFKPGQSEFQIQVGYQLCDDAGVCLFPRTEDMTVQINIEGEPVRGTSESSASLWLFLLMALAGGFLLNLMPCVLPLLSVKAMNLISQSGEKRPVLVKHGLYYTGGILASFWILSLVIVLLQRSGQLLGWGFQFQSPLFLSILISVIFLFALSLFEVFILLPPPSGLNKADSLSRRGGYSGSFFTGIFAVFVATPCTAPFLGTAMGFAFSQSGGVVFLIMTLTGIGLSLPFLLLGFFPGFFRILPKPGKWMDRFREAMAFLLMATAVYLSTTLLKQVGRGFSSFIWFILVLSVSAWIWGWSSKQSRKKFWRRFFVVLPMAGILVSGFFLLDFSGSAPDSQAKESYWSEFSSGEVARLTAANTPLFLAFSAEWCTSCKVNERTVLDTDRGRELLESRGIVSMKGDLTVNNPEAMEWIYSHGRAGVPLYLLYLPGEEVQILPEILTFQILEDAFSSLPIESGELAGP